MKEWFFKFAPLALMGVCAGISITAVFSYDMIGLNMIIISCAICQLLLFLYCGFIIKKLHQQANIDYLTGIYNRRYFFSRMSSIKKMEFPVSLMMIDIDNFKRINDTYGHLAGDETLKEFVKVLKRNTRNTDMIARLGGEEFAVVMPQTGHEHVYAIAQRIKQAVEANDFVFESTINKITVSIGIATTKFPIHTDRFLKYADRALYKAKETKNVVVAYEQLEIEAI